MSSRVSKSPRADSVLARPQRILVTGAGGFIGSHLAVELAERGHRVVALDLDLERVEHLEAAGHFELLEGDVTDPKEQRKALHGVQVVFHLAATHLGVSTAPEEFWKVNRDGVRTLTESAGLAGVQRFVHCSTVGVYGRLREVPADETTLCRPELTYDKSKLAGEGIVLEAAKRGLPAVILRPVWVYGPGCPRTEKLFRAIEKRRFLVAGGGHCLRHCIYIKDMVEAFRLAAESDEAVGQTIVVGDAGAVTVRQLVDEIARLAGRLPPRSLPLPLLLAAAGVVEATFKPLGLEPPISRRTLRFFTGNTSFDTARASRILGFEPRYDLRKGLSETYELLFGDPPWRLSLSDRHPERNGEKEGASIL